MHEKKTQKAVATSGTPKVLPGFKTHIKKNKLQ